MQEKNLHLQNIFDKLIQAFLIFIPWSAFVWVFLVYKIGIPGANFFKEILLLAIIGLLLFLLYNKWKQTKQNPLRLTYLDAVILMYFIVMSIITIFTTGIKGLVFGGRYDFIFLIVFLVFYHGSQFLKYSIAHYIKIFLISAGAMLFVSGLLKFPLNEELLLYFGYSANPSLWDFGGAPPIFHGIDGASVRRFQGILDGPNTMGAFIILYIGMLVYYFRNKKDWYFVIGVVVVGLVTMLLYTYSRSAMGALIGGFIIALLGGLTFLWKNYKKQVIALGLILWAFVWIVSLKYSGVTESILGRAASTKGHAERMIVGYERFKSEPLGQGMGSAGPAYRHVMNLKETDRATVEEQDRFYIPESWYIQQFIEWGIIGGILFIVILAILFFWLFGIHSVLAGMFAAIGAMNLLLHTYESSVLSFTLFALVGIILGYSKTYAKNKKS